MGFKEEMFVKSVDENLFCSICHEVLQDPHGCKDGHSFCKDCITEWLRTRQMCPLDNNKVQASNLVRNLIANNMVQNLEVWCQPPEKDEGAAASVPEHPCKVSVQEIHEQKCGWKGKLQSLSKHRETCPFQEVQCLNENCNETMQRRELQNHDLVCKYKKMVCNECRKRLVRHELQGHTADECPETLILCPNKCSKPRQGQIQQIKRVDLNNHLQNICPKTKVFCPFKDQGCPDQVERQDVEKHVQDNMAAHMLLLAKENNQLKKELTRVKEELHIQVISSRSYTWTVHDYPELYKNHPNGSCIESPPFWLRGHKWHLSLYPNGDNANGTGFLSLYLNEDDDDSQASSDTMLSVSSNESAILFRLTVISQKPGTDDVSNNSKNVFTKKINNWGWNKFMKASDALSPSYCTNGRLTIQCTIEPDKPQ